jgi:hypothetical protein
MRRRKGKAGLAEANDGNGADDQRQLSLPVTRSPAVVLASRLSLLSVASTPKLPSARRVIA